MLANTPHPSHRWIGPELLAFSVARPSNAKKEEQTCCSSLLHTCLLSPQVVRCAHARKRRDLVIGTTASGAVQSQRGLSCLRGGSGDERDSPQGNGGGIPTAKQAADTQVNKQGPQAPAAAFSSQQGASAGEKGGGGVFGGVALVTERSTATGGSTGRRCYSVLPDGRLQVGPHTSVSTHQLEPHTSRKCTVGSLFYFERGGGVVRLVAFVELCFCHIVVPSIDRLLL